MTNISVTYSPWFCYLSYLFLAEKYNSTVKETIRFMALPNNCLNVDLACAVLEEMAFGGSQNVLPAYYEKALKIKYVSDSASGKMINIIRSSLTADIGVIFGSGFANLCHVPRELIGKDSSAFISEYIKLKSKAVELYNRFTPHLTAGSKILFTYLTDVHICAIIQSISSKILTNGSAHGTIQRL